MAKRRLHPSDFMTYRLDNNGTYGVYDVDKLVAAARRAPIRRVPIRTFAASLSNENTFALAKDGRIVSPLSPNDVLRGKGGRRGAMHRERAERANLAYPIAAVQGGTVIDGLHRLMKAKQEGRKTVLAKVLPEMPRRAMVRTMKLQGG